MKIYNTLSRTKEEFVPQKAGHVNMYVCGPTVYGLAHIGNMRTQVVFDSLRRFLLHKGYTLTLVQNFTDVDDKIIQRALEEGISAADVAEKYIEENFFDADAMGILRGDIYPRVTCEMDEIIAMIAELVDAGRAYERAGHVFFEARGTDNYGKLSRKNPDDLLAGARVEVNDLKDSPMDFVLWKPAKPGEPFWDSPWGTGRPGWHIECSAMARKYLGHVDIHGGGEDLIFPHHENEIAQSEALQSEPFAKYWMHNGSLTSGHKKMSKSLGNFATLREVSEKFPHEVIRFFLLSGHYRMPMEYSEELLGAAQQGFRRVKQCWELLGEVKGSGELKDEEVGLLEAARGFSSQFEARLEDDFNTADAIAVMFEFVKFANVRMRQEMSKILAEELRGILDHFMDILGLARTVELVSDIDDLIAQRQEARKNKDFKTADRIRDELAARGITLEDTPTGVRWTSK